MRARRTVQTGIRSAPCGAGARASPLPLPLQRAPPARRPGGHPYQGLLISPHHQFTTRHRPRRSILPCDPPGHDGRFNHHNNQILLILHATTTTRVLDQVAASRQVARTDPAQLLSISLHVCVFLPLGLSIDLERNSEHNKQRGRMRTGHLNQNQGHAGRPAIKNSTPHQPAPPTLHQL